MPKIFDVALIGARRDRFGTHAFQLFALTDIGGNANHPGAIPLFKPRDDD
jgi:hypothetical protein